MGCKKSSDEGFVLLWLIAHFDYLISWAAHVQRSFQVNKTLQCRRVFCLRSPNAQYGIKHLLFSAQPFFGRSLLNSTLLKVRMFKKKLWLCFSPYFDKNSLSMVRENNKLGALWFTYFVWMQLEFSYSHLHILLYSSCQTT